MSIIGSTLTTQSVDLTQLYCYKINNQIIFVE